MIEAILAPLFTSPSTVNYGSIPVSITVPAEDLFTIFVIREGQSTSQAFSVRAHPTNTVDELRKAIWTSNRLRVGYFAAEDVPLALVSIPDEVHTMHENQWLYHTAFKRALRPTELLIDVFDNRPPPSGTIHIVLGDVRRGEFLNMLFVIEQRRQEMLLIFFPC